MVRMPPADCPAPGSLAPSTTHTPAPTRQIPAPQSTRERIEDAERVRRERIQRFRLASGAAAALDTT
jgi:hypothetical protein